MASINLALKYEPQILTKWNQESFLAGKASTKYDFIGVSTIRVYTPQTVALSDYTKSGSSRFGTPVEMGDSVQELTLSQDKSFAITIDKGNTTDQMNIKGAGDMMNLQIKEQLVPYEDKYALKQWAWKAHKSVVVAEPSKSTIVGFLEAGLAELDEHNVPSENRYIALPVDEYSKLRLSSEYLASDPLSSQILPKGVVGTFMMAKIVRVPSSYMPTGVQFLIWNPEGVLYPMKISTLRILNEVAGIDGNVLEGRSKFDAFVLGAKEGSVYAGVLTANKTADPVITPTGDSYAVGAVSGVTFYYTTDGTDPRYSMSKTIYSGAVTLTDGVTIKVFGRTDAKCDSDVVSATYTA